MNTGDLRHRIALQSETKSRDEAGGVTKSWSTYVTVWGMIMPMRGKEVMEANKPVSDQSFDFKIRYYSTVDVKHRLVFKGRTFEINSIDNWQEQNIYQILRCSELDG